MLAAPGTLDPSFSGDGKVTVDGFDIDAVDVAVGVDGKTVVAGMFRTQGADDSFAVVRFNVDGTLDQTFGPASQANHKGIVFTHVGAAGKSNQVGAVAVQSDGKIVVAGQVHVLQDFAVVRLNVDGTMDTSFDGDGIRTVGFDKEVFGAEDMVLQGDGKIVLVGGYVQEFGNHDFLAVRLNPNGSLDGSFNGDGKVTVTLDGAESAEAVTLGQNGTIVMVGHSRPPDPSSSSDTFATVRLMANGSLDTTFSFDGKFVHRLPGRNFSVAEGALVQPDGRIVVVGFAGGPIFEMVRYTSDGLVDTTFGPNGTGIVETPGMGSAQDVIRAADGGIIVGGSDASGKAAVASYDANGLLKSTFGNGGIVATDFGTNRSSVIAGLARGSGRRFVSTGGNFAPTARYLEAGANLISVTPFDSVASEGKVDPALFVVRRTEILPMPTRVFFSIGGTAVGGPLALPSTRDYTLDKMFVDIPVFGGAGDLRPFVEIPAGEQFAFVTLTTVNDTRAEGTETATFTIAPDASYDVGTPASLSITIKDDDQLTFKIGTSTVKTSNKNSNVDVGEELRAVVTWTVPEGGWRQLDGIDLRLRDEDDQNALTLLHFDEASGAFSLSSTGASAAAALVPGKCSFAAAGPTAPTVTCTFTFRFNAGAAKHKYVLEVAAENDAGVTSGFESAGRFHVHATKPKGKAPASVSASPPTLLPLSGAREEDDWDDLL